MEKKEYITPTMEAYEVVNANVICASPPEYDGPFGAKDSGSDDWFDDDETAASPDINDLLLFGILQD